MGNGITGNNWRKVWVTSIDEDCNKGRLKYLEYVVTKVAGNTDEELRSLMG